MKEKSFVTPTMLSKLLTPEQREMLRGWIGPHWKKEICREADQAINMAIRQVILPSYLEALLDYYDNFIGGIGSDGCIIFQSWQVKMSAISISSPLRKMGGFCSRKSI